MPTSDDDHLTIAMEAALTVARNRENEPTLLARRDYHWWRLRNDPTPRLTVNATHKLISEAFEAAGRPAPSMQTVRDAVQGEVAPRDPDA